MFEAIEANSRSRRSVEDNKAFLSRQQAASSDSAEDGWDDEHDDMDFEDAMDQPARKKRKIQEHDKQELGSEDEGSEEESDEEIAWEDATKQPPEDEGDSTNVTGDLELTLDSLPDPSTVGSTYGSKKGPSKIERQIRTNTHCMHVQSLLYHNLIRNGWTCDKETQKILKSTIPSNIEKEIERWRHSCGDTLTGPEGPNGNEADASKTSPKKKSKKYSKTHKNQRDWGGTADEQENGVPNLSQGDPTVRLLKALAAWWRKRFSITSPGIRKQGWKDAVRLQNEIKSFRNDEHDPEEHGERLQSRAEFRELARKCQGSRDLGAQLFVALLRGIGLDSRLVASLQTLGFGWSKGEDAVPPKKKTKKKSGPNTKANKQAQEDSDIEMLDGPLGEEPKTAPQKKPQKQKTKAGSSKNAAIDLSDDSGLSDPPDSDNDSLIDITPPTPTTSVQRYDRDLAFPHYWAEVLSPTSQTWIPVDPIVLNLVANTDDSFSSFEPRGAKAEKAHQVLAYIIAYNPDGTAKDVTVRYLKRHMLPGKTKGVRMPIEKIPIHNKRGKVLRTETYDWFAHVMSIYAVPDNRRTAADDIEDQRELKPVKPEKKAKEGGEDTLQGLKTSAEFVLERHLRREEAIKADARPVRDFTTGKGDKAKSEPVYLRQDILVGKTVETWHKEGREIKEGEQAIKHVPFRAVTTIRKRELEEAERASGEKMKQGLYSKEQTRFIVPPPIGEDRAIPKNSYGNIDVYVPSMVPKGAVHIPLKGTGKVCKRLGVEYAEACTGFEFGHRMAVPVLTGVVVAEENEDAVIDAWEVEEGRKREREREKREKTALGGWRRFLNGLRVVERVRRQYGDGADEHFDEVIQGLSGKDKGKGKGKKDEPAENGKAKSRGKGRKNKQEPKEEDDELLDVNPDQERSTAFTGEEEGGGGFIPEGMEVEEVPQRPAPLQPPQDQDMNGANDPEEEGGGGFLLDQDEKDTNPPTADNRSPPRKQESEDALSVHADFEFDDDVKAESEEEVDTKPVFNEKKPTSRVKKSTPGKTNTPTSPISATMGWNGLKAGKKSAGPGDVEAESEEEDDEDGGGNSDEAEPKGRSKAPAKRPQRRARKSKAPATDKASAKGKAKSDTGAGSRRASGRNAARKSTEAVRSHYFGGSEGGSEGEEEEEGNSGSD